MRNKFQYLIIFLFFLCLQAYGQNNGIYSTDTVHVKGNQFIILSDTSIFVEHDTIISLPDTIALKYKYNRVGSSSEFYKNVKETFYKRKFTKEIYDLLFVDPDKLKQQKIIETPIKPTALYEHFNGEIINKISIEKLDIFGNITRPNSSKIEYWAINAGNKVHVYTKDRIIKNNIFFKEGDPLHDIDIIDSERILRSLPFIRDARIYVDNSKEGKGLDVLIVIKDMWSIAPNFDIGNYNNFGVELVERNFIGYGHRLSGAVDYNANYQQQVGYSASYEIFNIKKSFINAELSFANSQKINQLGLHVYREFVTPETQYAGGLSIFRKDIELLRVFPDTVFTFRTEFNENDLWVGRSFQLKNSTDQNRLNLQLSSGFSRVQYFNRPTVTSDSNRLFLNKNLHLFTVGITKRGYRKSTLISGYGRTEDIPMGFILEGTIGRESNEFNKRNYIGGRFGVGNYLDHIGYFRPELIIGSYFNGNLSEQGVLHLELSYFSFLYKIRRYNLRQFLKVTYTKGSNRYFYEYVNINRDEGVIDINYAFLRGSEKIRLSVETVAFTPIYLLGFRFTFFTFADLAIINNVNPIIWDNTLYQNYGVGLRLHNENIAFSTIQIRLGYSPVVPPNNQSWNSNFSNRSNVNFLDFQTRKPQVVEFR